MTPLWVDAYLLYLPGFVFLLPLLALTFCSRRGWLSMFRLSLALAITFGYLFVIRWNSPDTKGGEYGLVSLNLQSHATDVGGAIQEIQTFKPDFVCFQEIWHRPQLELVESLLENYQVLGAASDDDKRQTFNDGTFVAIREDWKIEESSLKEESALVRVSRSKENLVIVSVHGPRSKQIHPSGLKLTAKEQREKAEELASELSDFSEPIIIAGDFNAPESGPAFKILTTRFHQAFHQAGSGFGLTFPATFPLARIDHVLGTEQVRFIRYQAHDFGSDHLGLVVDIQTP
jgi:vancomycin resistance protein VanJ